MFVRDILPIKKNELGTLIQRKEHGPASTVPCSVDSNGRPALSKGKLRRSGCRVGVGWGER